LFRWLSKKYPKIGQSTPHAERESCTDTDLLPIIFTVEQVVEDKPIKEQGLDGEATITPIDYGSPNPNGFEVDNLYCELATPSWTPPGRDADIRVRRIVDMNGIVHPCTHPEGRVSLVIPPGLRNE
jgi:5'-3' exonuclease